MRAQQIITAAQSCDILVPEEVAVLGVNNDPIRCELAYPPLSSVVPNVFQPEQFSRPRITQIDANQQPQEPAQFSGH